MTKSERDALRALCEKATPEGCSSREIDLRNEVWGPRLTAFRKAVWPEMVVALIDALDQCERERERLTVNHDHSCTCPHGDAREPLVNHDKACPIRVNKIKRIAPEVALSRLAAALDSGDEVDDLTAQRDAAIAALEQCRAERDEALQLVRDNFPATREAIERRFATITTERDEAVSYRDRYFQNWNDAEIQRESVTTSYDDIKTQFDAAWTATGIAGCVRDLDVELSEVVAKFKTERNEARTQLSDALAALEQCRAEMAKTRDEALDDIALTAEHETAEQIAAWVRKNEDEFVIRGARVYVRVPGNTTCVTTLTSAIRAHAWKPAKQGADK